MYKSSRKNSFNSENHLLPYNRHKGIDIFRQEFPIPSRCSCMCIDIHKETCYCHAVDGVYRMKEVTAHEEAYSEFLISRILNG